LKTTHAELLSRLKSTLSRRPLCSSENRRWVVLWDQSAYLLSPARRIRQPILMLQAIRLANMQRIFGWGIGFR
jgi:hypothetical protein